jgi:hypothetical protein
MHRVKCENCMDTGIVVGATPLALCALCPAVAQAIEASKAIYEQREEEQDQ